MKQNELLDLYSDYLLTSFGATTATGLSQLLEGTVQTNHFFAALCGFIKLERLRVETKLNHFALQSKLYLNALHSAFFALRQLSPPQLAA